DASVGHILPGTDGVRRSISSRPRHILVESAPRYLPGQKVLLVGTQLLRTQLLRRTAEVPGKLYDTQDLGLDGPRRLVAQAEVVDVTLTKRSQEIVSTQKAHAPGGIPQRNLLCGPMRSAKPSDASTTKTEMTEGTKEREPPQPPRSGLVQRQSSAAGGARWAMNLENTTCPVGLYNFWFAMPC